MDNFDLNSFVYYQDRDFYYFRKPTGIASSRWKSVSFLDLICNEYHNSQIQNIVQSQLEFFWKEKELWLLNRLDWPTTWLLYFAKNPKIYNKFRLLQSENKVEKFYIAVVYWNIENWIKENWNKIRFPIMHHKYNNDRMVVIDSPDKKNKWKWKFHEVETEIIEYQYLQQENRSVIMIKIHKWIRHQIRAHLSSIWFPICGDQIYCKSKNKDFDKLQLFSVWMKINEL